MMQNILSTIVEKLKQINGVSALVLGGSRARGTESSSSDIDIGIYYGSAKELDMAQLRRAAKEIDDEHRDGLITDIGGWGPWINGGGWLKVGQTPVDFLFRDLTKVSRVVEQCIKGEITIDYQPGHPHGFVNSIYLAEVACCRVLWDPHGVVAELKGNAVPYPPLFQKAIIQKFMWEAYFATENGYKGSSRRDISYIAGCCFRAVSCLNQVLFALNESFLMNEKGAVAIADSFPLAPSNYSARIQQIFSLLTGDPEGLRNALDLLLVLTQETERLARL